MRDDNARYEPTDADAGRTYGAGLAILAAMILTALGLVPVFKMLGRHETAAAGGGASGSKCALASSPSSRVQSPCLSATNVSSEAISVYCNIVRMSSITLCREPA